MGEDLKITEQTLAGTSFINWLKLLWENRFKVGRCYIPRALFISLVSIFTIPFAIYEKVRFGRRIKKTKIEKPPIFIIGHWRSGTTYLHMLLTCDQNFAYVSNLQAIMPLIFLGSGGLFKHVLKRFMPTTRRMDNVKLRIYEPQEEEYAIANLSPYSLYHGTAFPQKMRYYSRYCSLEGLPEKMINKWKKVFRNFLKKVTFHSKGKQLLLKNPSNTFRIKLLLEMFPNAKFIHIYRNPFDVYPSTLHMYKKMFPYYYLHTPLTESEGEEFIIDLYEQMFKKFFQEKELIPKGNLVEVKYEDFILNPLGEVQKIYKVLGLPDFDKSKEAFNSYIQSQRDYRPNKHELNETTKQKIASRWRITFEQWGYSRVERVEGKLERQISRRERRIEKLRQRKEKRESKE